MLQQLLSPHLPQPGDALQPGSRGAAAVLFPVVGDGKAVDLLLHLSHQGEKRRALLYAQLLPLGRHQRPGPVPVVLYHAQNRHGKSLFRQGLLRHGGVLPAAVH